MLTLLKDMPEHAERIETSVFLRKDITDIIRDTEPFMIKLELASILCGDVMSKIQEFVSNNYVFRGDIDKKVRSAIEEVLSEHLDFSTDGLEEVVNYTVKEILAK